MLKTGRRRSHNCNLSFIGTNNYPHQKWRRKLVRRSHNCMGSIYHFLGPRIIKSGIENGSAAAHIIAKKSIEMAEAADQSITGGGECQ